MEIPEMKEWESPSGWCRRVAHLYGMNETQAEVLEEVRRVSYIQGVNDILERRSLTPDPSKEASPPTPFPSKARLPVAFLQGERGVNTFMRRMKVIK